MLALDFLWPFSSLMPVAMANCCGRASVHVLCIVLYCAFYVILCVCTSAV